MPVLNRSGGLGAHVLNNTSPFQPRRLATMPHDRPFPFGIRSCSSRSRELDGKERSERTTDVGDLEPCGRERGCAGVWKRRAGNGADEPSRATPADNPQIVSPPVAGFLQSTPACSLQTVNPSMAGSLQLRPFWLVLPKPIIVQWLTPSRLPFLAWGFTPLMEG